MENLNKEFGIEMLKLKEWSILLISILTSFVSLFLFYGKEFVDIVETISLTIFVLMFIVGFGIVMFGNEW